MSSEAIEKYRGEIQKLRLIDDLLFNAVFSNSTESVEYILRIILHKPDLIVKSVQTQKGIENIYGRGVRLDVYAEDSTGKLYNIEVQKANAGAIPRRARYNSAMLDYHALNKGTDFKILPETYVIFITENDVLAGDEQIYHIDRVVRETGKMFGDDAHIIYVNAGRKEGADKELADLMKDFFCVEPEEMRHKKIAQRTDFIKRDRNEVSRMCDFIERLLSENNAKAEARGEAKGEVKNLLNNIRQLMKNVNWTAQEAMNALGLPKEKQAELKPLI